MAAAIKKISVARGHDVTRYCLACFGGAGGQHAAMIADRLGMRTVHIHPFSGVLSAYGMGLADVRAGRSRAVVLPLEVGSEAKLEEARTALEKAVRAELEDQGLTAEDIEVFARLHVRYAGTDTPLDVPFAGAAEARAAFEAAHRARFGFVFEDKALIAEVSVFDIFEGPALGESKKSIAAMSPSGVTNRFP